MPKLTFNAMLILMKRRGFSSFVVIGIVVLVIIIGVLMYLILRKPSPTTQTLPTNNATTTTPQSTSTQVVISTIGSVINDEYSLFVLNSNDQENCGGIYSNSIQYYDGGTISSGPYAGYHRVIAGFPLCAPPGGDYAIVFATKDYQTFIVNASSSDYNSSSTSYNKTKVVGFADLPMDSPPTTIPLGNFVLVKNDSSVDNYWLAAAPTSTSLASLVPGLTFYADPGRNYTGMSGAATDTTYLGNDNDVIVKTASGPLFDYFLIPKEEFENPNFDQYPAAFENGESEMFYQSSQISSSVPLFQAYGQIAPGICGSVNVTYLVNGISQNDLTQVATTADGTPLFISSASNAFSQLEQDEFNAKVEPWIQEGATSTADPNSSSLVYTPLPSSSAYFQKNPVLIFQDPWGRWTGLGETDIPTTGGCDGP